MSNPAFTALPPAIVLLYAHNAASYLEDTLASFEKQAYPHTRLVIVADPSTDDTSARLRRFAEQSPGGTVLITNATYLGRAKSFNRGLLWTVQEAKRALAREPTLLWNGIHPALIKPAGVALFDAGNHMLPNRLLAPMSAWTRHPDAHFIYTEPEGVVPSVPAGSGVAHSNGWTLRVGWLLTLNTAALLDPASPHMNLWDTFVQLLGAGPAVALDQATFRYGGGLR